MDAKKILTNKSFCVLPWTGFEFEPNGNIKNCIISTSKLGNIEEQDITAILSGEKNLKIKQQMLKYKNICNFKKEIEILDARRNQSARSVLTELFRELKNV